VFENNDENFADVTFKGAAALDVTTLGIATFCIATLSIAV